MTVRRWLDSLVPTGYVSQAALDRLMIGEGIAHALNLCAGGKGSDADGR